MGKKSRTSVLKRQRELKKAEKAALKQAQKDQRMGSEEAVPGQQVATQDDLAGYGLGPTDDEEEEETA